MGKRNLIVFCNDYIGGVANYHRNLVTNRAFDVFNKTIIFIHVQGHTATRLVDHFGLKNEFVYEVDFEEKSLYSRAKELEQFIENEPCIVVTNYNTELEMLHLRPKNNRTVVYLCHDEMYLPSAKLFSFLIDKYIAHNPIFYSELKKLLPDRVDDIFYLPYGVGVEAELHKEFNINNGDPLRLVWLARLDKLKGIYEVPKINERLKQRNIEVQWTIIGTGPEYNSFVEAVKKEDNFVIINNASDNQVKQLLKSQDAYILPSSLDGLPVALLETMGKGIVPILYKFNDGITKVVTDQEGFVVEQGDIERMTEVIVELAMNRDILINKAQNAHEKILKEYNIDIQAKKYADFYLNIDEAVSKPNAPSTLALYGLRSHKLIPNMVYKALKQIQKGWKKIQ